MNTHLYYVYASGIAGFKPEYFSSRKEAEIYMQNVCSKNDIHGMECYECDKHQRAYSNDRVQFYINREDVPEVANQLWMIR